MEFYVENKIVFSFVALNLESRDIISNDMQ